MYYQPIGAPEKGQANIVHTKRDTPALAEVSHYSGNSKTFTRSMRRCVLVSFVPFHLRPMPEWRCENPRQRFPFHISDNIGTAHYPLLPQSSLRPLSGIRSHCTKVRCS